VHRQLNVLDIENLGMHYILTGQRWRANFLRNYEEIKSVMKFDDRFMRTWDFYLASGLAGFSLGHLHLIQMVLTNGVRPDYPWTREFLYEPLESTPIENQTDQIVFAGSFLDTKKERIR
ncbi:MAG TPA: class I SAM-dependent methyltransferase, partial [Candidatus Saccharimonadales bacterium]|nr:class I SAM-dependent methyltransferase [Candidatus Saccharimonadales bacterium]